MSDKREMLMEVQIRERSFRTRDQVRFPKDIPSKAESRRIHRTCIGLTGTPGKRKSVNRGKEV